MSLLSLSAGMIVVAFVLLCVIGSKGYLMQGPTAIIVVHLLWLFLVVGVNLSVIAVVGFNTIGAVVVVVGVVAVLAAYLAPILRFWATRVHQRHKALIDKANGGDVAGALREAKDWANQQPQNPWPWMTLAIVYPLQENWTAAEEAIARYEQLEPKSYFMIVHKPACIAKQGRLADADTAYRAAIAQSLDKKPNTLEIVLRLDYCQLLIDLGRGNEAVEQFRAARKRRDAITIREKSHQQYLDTALQECRTLVAPFDGD